MQVKEDKRERILDAAFDKFKKYGFAKTTVSEIAHQAQVGKGTIYFYFASKEEVLLALVDREVEKGFTQVATAISQESSAADKLKKLFQVTCDFFQNNELVSKIIAMDQELVLSLITEKNKDIQQLSIQAIKTLLELGKSEGRFREIDFEKAAYIFDSMIRSFHYLHYLGLDTYKPGEIFDTLFEVMFKGLVK